MRFLSLAILLAMASFTASSQGKFAYKRTLLMMGTRFELTAISEDKKFAEEAIEAGINEIQRIENLISSWDVNSQTSEINRNAGIEPVVIDRELFDLIERSLKISELTQGAFDISFAAVDRIWQFDGSMKEPPTDAEILSSVSKIDYHNIVLDEEKSTVFLREKGMKIGFGGIGKGYAANRAKMIMQEMGISGGVVNASGDLITWGEQENGGDWRIGIGDPKNPNQVMAWLVVQEMAVVTSGNYEKFFFHEGKRYSHIIDPKTGYPTTGIKSVTIVCPDAEISDALATSVFVLGEKDGLSMLNALKGIEGLIITDGDRMLTTENLQLNFYERGTNYKESGLSFKTGS